MPEEKSYDLKTIEDIVNVVNEKNIDFFIKDFATFLHFRLNMKSLAAIAGDKVEMQSFFRWIDDGKNNINITINIQEEK